MAYQRSPRMQERLRDNRRSIVLAARRLIAIGGFRATSMTAVARETRLSTGALYRYFPSKSELLVEVLTDAVTHEVQILRGIIERPASARQRLRDAVESFATRAMAGPNLAYAFIAEPADKRVEAARLVCRAQFGEVFKDVLRDGVAAGEFPQQPIDISAACIVGAFTEALVRPMAAGSPTLRSVESERLIRSIVDFCLRAAGTQAPTHSSTEQKQ
jgi:AcrR family transcriptional regulator